MKLAARDDPVLRTRNAEPRVRPNFVTFATGTYYHKELGAASLPERLRVVVAALGPPGRALDVGCHTGFLCTELERLGWQAEGLEANADAAAVARSKNIRVALGSVEDRATWAELDGQFDAILLLDILEHTYDPWTVLETARSRLGPGGRVFVTLPNVASWQVLRPLVFKRQFFPPSTGLDDPTHIRFFTLRDAVDMLTTAGYGSIQVLSAWSSVPAGWRLRRLPPLSRMWTRAWMRWAPSLTIAVPLLIAEPGR